MLNLVKRVLAHSFDSSKQVVFCIGCIMIVVTIVMIDEEIFSCTALAVFHSLAH